MPETSTHVVRSCVDAWGGSLARPGVTSELVSQAPNGENSVLVVGDAHLRCTVLGAAESASPIIFLHEGLGSIELWRSFPDNVVRATGTRGVVYSRQGNGWSDPLDDVRKSDYMHAEARDVLPDVASVFAPEPPILIGHSDGASIALIYAGAGNPVAGLVLIAPHVFAEPLTRNSIGALRDRFPGSDMAEKMKKYHADPDATFYGWADIWLDEQFETWNIAEYLPAITCPTLTIQGDADEYGTLLQLDAIDAGLDHPAQRLVVNGARHAPHISHPTLVTDAVVDFIRRVHS